VKNTIASNPILRGIVPVIDTPSLSIGLKLVEVLASAYDKHLHSSSQSRIAAVEEVAGGNSVIIFIGGLPYPKES